MEGPGKGGDPGNPGQEGPDEDLPPEEEFLSPGELKEGWVLACRYEVDRDLVVYVPGSREAVDRKASLKSRAEEVKPEPAVEKRRLHIPPPGPGDNRGDLERLLEGLAQDNGQGPRRENIRVGHGLLRDLPRVLRQEDFLVTGVLVGDRLVQVEPGDTRGAAYGLALDIGTTTLAASLVSLERGEVLAVEATTNPQGSYGADVISRIQYASRGWEQLKQLQDSVLQAFHQVILRLLEKTGLEGDKVYEAVAVGNTTMGHLFMGVDPTYLAYSPFTPAFSQALEVPAGELGLPMNPRGRVLLLPGIAAYVGSDTVGVMLAAGLHRQDKVRLAIDIGTNGEMVLAGRGHILACSTAAGPAFEGTRIKHGMRAGEGAIEGACLEGPGEGERAPGNGELRLQVIGDVPPRGICGSGLVDLVAVLLKAGVIGKNGRFNRPGSAPGLAASLLENRLRPGDRGEEFLLAPASPSTAGVDLVLTQKDVRELQLAKGAIYAGVQILLKEMGLGIDEIDEVLLAGAFGNYLDRDSALAIGLLPPVPREKVIPVGNAAGDGARLALISRPWRQRAGELAGKTRHVELSTRGDFQEIFLGSLELG